MSEPDRAVYAPVTDHVAAGLALLTHLVPRTRVVASTVLPSVIVSIFAPWLGQVQELEDAFAAVLGLAIATAENDQLAQIGAILGAARAGLVDEDYRQMLAAAALVVGSSGTIPELVTIANLLAGDPGAAVRDYAGAVVVTPAAPPTVPSPASLALLRRAVAGGVQLQLVDPPEGGMFRFSADAEAPTVDAAHGFGDGTTDTGGHFAGVLV